MNPGIPDKLSLFISFILCLKRLFVVEESSLSYAQVTRIYSGKGDSDKVKKVLFCSFNLQPLSQC